MLSDYSLDLNSETMISFLEMENVQEVETVEKKQVFKEQVTRPSVIMKPMKEMKKEAKEPNHAVTTNMMTEDGQNVVIVIAPSSPSESLVSISQDPLPSPRITQDSDPEWSPSPASVSSPPGPMRPRKKYARSKPPQAPTGPYPTDKKERKKAQIRTAAFRYREKMKKQEDSVEEELEALEDKNTNLREQLSEMETEFKYLKKLMMEAGLGSYAAAVKY